MMDIGVKTQNAQQHQQQQQSPKRDVESKHSKIIKQSETEGVVEEAYSIQYKKEDDSVK